MPQGVNAAALGDAGSVASQVVVALAAGAIDAARGIGARREQPVCAASLGATGTPIHAQLLEQFGCQQAIAVLASLALDDPDAHAVGGRVDVAAAQIAQLAQSQAAGIGRRQKGSRLQRHRCGQDCGDLGARQHLGQTLRVAAHGDLSTALGLAQYVADQEAQCARGDVDGGAGSLPLLQQVQQVRLHLLVAQQLWAAVVVPGHLPDRAQVSLLGARSKAAQHHRIDHASAQRCHRRLRGPGKIPRTQGTTQRKLLCVRATTASAV